MKNSYSFFKKSFAGMIILVIFVVLGIEIFQGQSTDYIKDYDKDNDYRIDQPTKEFQSHVSHFRGPGDNEALLITDQLGFDNFQMGVNNAEQHISANPNNPLQMFFGVNSSTVAQYYSTDGNTFSSTGVSLPGGTCCDPWTAADSLGNLYYSVLASANWVAKSTNFGQSFSSFVNAVVGGDRNTIAADQTGGPYANYVYAALWVIGGQNLASFARSTNLGVSWTTTFGPVANTTPGNMIAVGPNGNIQGGTVSFVTITGSNPAPSTYNFYKSNDGGATFTLVGPNAISPGYVGTLNTQSRLVINNARTRPYPMIAMDNSYGPHRGRLYCVYASNVPAGNGNKPDILCQYSDDQGATWSSSVTVNDNSSPELSDQWYPAIWCVKETGRLYIKWYDTRENPATYQVNVYASYSDDGGVTFAPNQKLTTQAWTYPTPACGANQNCYRGDYDAITANTKASFSVWYDGRSGNYQNMGAYLPDYALQVNPSTLSINNGNFTTFRAVVPAVKLYTDTVVFSATITPTPSAGALNISFPNGNILRQYPDSLLVRVSAAPGTTAGAYTINLKSNGPNGTPVHLRTVSLNVGLVGITNIAGIPDKFELSQNFPNPFNPTTKISYDLKTQTPVKISVFDASGKLVEIRNNGVQQAGTHFVYFSGETLASGVYFYRLETDFFTDTKKMLLVK